MGPVVILAASALLGQESGPCTLADVVGVWNLAAIETEHAQTAEVMRRAPHEWLRFTPDGAAVWLASNQTRASLETLHADLDAADEIDGGDWRVSFPQAGRLILSRDGRPMEAFDCVVASGSEPDARAGDLILTSAPGHTRTRRVQRRVAF